MKQHSAFFRRFSKSNHSLFEIPKISNTNSETIIIIIIKKKLPWNNSNQVICNTGGKFVPCLLKTKSKTPTATVVYFEHFLISENDCHSHNSPVLHGDESNYVKITVKLNNKGLIKHKRTVWVVPVFLSFLFLNQLQKQTRRATLSEKSAAPFFCTI